MTMQAVVLDVGGTAIKSGLYENGTVHDILETPTNAHLGGPHLVESIRSIISSRSLNCSFDCIGISTAGQVNPETGTIIYANENIPDYTGTELKKILEEFFHVPAAVENDVNSAAQGEAVLGAGAGESQFVCLTYGTGIGGAIVLDGSLYHGSSCSAGEFGALVTHPEDRDPSVSLFSGCYEKYASTTALVAKARAFDPSITDGRVLFSRIAEPEIQTLIDGWIMEIVYGLVTITHMLNPSCIVLGGGVMEQPYLLPKIRELFYQNIMPSFRSVKVKKAELGNKAGMTGAGILAQQLYDSRKGGF